MIEPEIEVVKVPSLLEGLPAWERIMERARQDEAALNELLTPEARARLRAAEDEFTRQVLEGP